MYGINRNRSGYQVIDDDDDRPPSSFPGFSSNHSVSQSHSETEPLVHRETGADLFGGPPLSHEISNDRGESNVNMKTSMPNEARWDHVENLDQFFTRVYEYHQGGGFVCISVRYLFSLLQFLFVISFSTFFLQCVDYPVLFNTKNTTADGVPITGKRHVSDAIVSNCMGRLHPLVGASLIFAIVFWLFRVIRVGYHLVQFYEIHNFYEKALGISDAELCNLTWYDVVRRVCQMQPHLHLIINKDRLSPLDVYQRILRFKNYFVALVNKEILPPVINVPFVGAMPYLSSGLKLNLEWLLFWGQWSPWKGPYALKDEFKHFDNDFKHFSRLVAEMESTIFYMGVANLIFSPLIFLYQILYSFFSYAELVKRDPGAFGSRRYSNYGRSKVRHFNELNHELRMRLSLSHRAAVQYMDQFISPLTEIVAKNATFVAGALFAVLFILSAWDEDVLTIEHVLTTMTVCGVVIVLCRSFIADENLIWWPESLLKLVINQIHYAPDTWRGKAHTDIVRKEFGHLFQLTAQFIVEELISPVITPFVLFFWVRPKAKEFVTFFHNFTVTVEGLGDVCSFAQMDVARHGDPRWNGDFQGETPAESGLGELRINEKVMANDGKTELSLLHFAATNPDWKPPASSARFINELRSRMERDTTLLRDATMEDNILLDSLHSLLPLQYPPQAFVPPGSLPPDGHPRVARTPFSTSQLLASLHQSAAMNQHRSVRYSSSGREVTMDAATAEMSIHAMYLREWHAQRQSEQPEGDGSERAAVHSTSDIWGVPAQSTVSPRSRCPLLQSRMQLISESARESDDYPPDTFHSV